MKNCYLLICSFLLIHLSAFSQTWSEFRSVNKANLNVVGTYLNEDTLSVYGQTGLYSLPLGLANQFEVFRFTSSTNQTLGLDTSIIDTNQIINSNFVQPYQNSFVKFGTEGDVINQKFRLFYSIGSLDNFSNKIYVDTPSSVLSITFFKQFEDFYLLSMYKQDSISNNTGVILMLDSNLNIVNRLEVNCVRSTCYFNDIIYFKKLKKFVGVTSSRVVDSINQQNRTGNGVVSLDSNLNIIQGSSQLIEVNGNFNLGTFPVETFMGALAPVSDSTFMLMSGVINLSPINNPPNPNPAFFYDLALGIRNFNSPYTELGGKSGIYGAVDTSELGIDGSQQILKYDSNLFITSLTKRFYVWYPNPWNTEAAIYGFNEKGQLHWEYYLPFNDYCWVSRMDKDDKGGVWVTGQCTENVGNDVRSYAKVTYIDSIAFWPRISTTVSVEEPIKKAEEIKLFPNPAQDYFTVRQYLRPVKLDYILLDQTGRIMKEARSNYTDTQINIADLKSGIYFLRAIDAKGNVITTEKVIKL